jgi:hypothetical protein
MGCSAQIECERKHIKQFPEFREFRERSSGGAEQTTQLCGWDGNLFTRSKTVAGSAADRLPGLGFEALKLDFLDDGRDIGEINLLDGSFDNGVHFARESTLARS